MYSIRLENAGPYAHFKVKIIRLMARILFLTSSQPSINPRLRKSADAHAHAGHQVHVLYYHRTFWADVNDDLIFDQALWSRERIGGHPQDSPWQYLVSRIMRKTHELLGNVTKSHCRSTSSLKSQAIKWGPDLIIGHNPGILGPLQNSSLYYPSL